MSGHSKWATIRRKKSATDAKRGKIFTNLIKEIQISARNGGGDESANPRLRTAIAAARAANMPNDNIKKAIQRGTGELPGIHYEEISYEGYGPGGVAILVECMTDNKQRTVSEVRHLFSKYNGSLAENGAVSWMFDAKGVITIDSDTMDEDTLMEHVLESGAEDMSNEDGVFEVTCSQKNFPSVHAYFEKKGILCESAEVAKVPQSTIKVEGKDAKTLLKLMEGLEDSDDVQKVWANFDIDEKDMED
ncbi:MAG: YebC/PmpR family DNA-binding transcriptional regulator [Candidatus Latescibacteria bacterium]|nr:YebC/PmpR family DNA-binding transcriptional regulator [Candidatus Latescibacterota bacterium]